MGKMNELAIELEEENLEKIRVYIANDIRVTRELFIMQLALELYDYQVELPYVGEIVFTGDSVGDNDGDIVNVAIDIMSTIDEFVLGDNMNSLEINEKIFSSYFEVTEVEERPLKKYRVMYDIMVKPLVSLKRGRDTWRREAVVMDATSYKNAREDFREMMKQTMPDRRYKRVKVELYIPEIHLPKQDARPKPKVVIPGDEEIQEIS